MAIHRYLEDGYGYLSDGRVGSGIERTEQALTATILLLYGDEGNVNPDYSHWRVKEDPSA